LALSGAAAAAAGASTSGVSSCHISLLSDTGPSPPSHMHNLGLWWKRKPSIQTAALNGCLEKVDPLDASRCQDHFQRLKAPSNLLGSRVLDIFYEQ
jgi:hypothetical protein